MAVKKIKAFRKKNPFDAIAFSGSSGAGYAYPLSYLLKIPLIHVRKRGSSYNYNGVIEGTISAKRYIIVDDFISSGKTIKRIRREIQFHLGSNIKPVGIFLYAMPSYQAWGPTFNGIKLFSLPDKLLPVAKNKRKLK